jgi:hypothetical protein
MTNSTNRRHKAILLATAVTMTLLGGYFSSDAFGQKGQDQASAGPVQVLVGPDGSGVMTMPDGTQKPFGPNDGIVVDESDLASGRAAVTLGPGKPPMNLEQLRQKATVAVKEMLACGDDEWGVLDPRIQTILVIRAALGDTSGSAKMMSIIGRNVQGDAAAKVPGNVNEILADFRAAQRDFRLAINNEQTATEQLSTLLETLRAAEKTLRAELAAQRAALRDLVIRRQEAQLYQMGILD